MKNAARIEFVENLIDAAGYGIGYWARRPCMVDEDAQTYTITVQDEFVGDEFTREDGTTGTIQPKYKMTYGAIYKAAEAYVKDYPGNEGKVLRDDFRHNEAGEFDSSISEQVIQRAAFAHGVFG